MGFRPRAFFYVRAEPGAEGGRLYRTSALLIYHRTSANFDVADIYYYNKLFHLSWEANKVISLVLI